MQNQSQVQGQPLVENVPVLTPSALQRLVELKVGRVFSELKLGYVILKGILVELKQKSSGYYSGVLKDLAGTASVVCDVSKELFEKSPPYQYKQVRVRGILKPIVRQGYVQYVVDAADIEPEVELDGEIKKLETSFYELLRKHKKTSTQFPEKDAYHITVIHPQSGLVVADFENRLEELKREGRVTITHKPVNILDTGSIAKTKV